MSAPSKRYVIFRIVAFLLMDAYLIVRVVMPIIKAGTWDLGAVWIQFVVIAIIAFVVLPVGIMQALFCLSTPSAAPKKTATRSLPDISDFPRNRAMAWGVVWTLLLVGFVVWVKQTVSVFAAVLTAICVTVIAASVVAVVLLRIKEKGKPNKPQERTSQ